MLVSTLVDDVSALEPRRPRRPVLHGPDVDVTSVAHDSRLVGPGSLFVCLRGATSDGHDHAGQAVAAGAAALLVDHVIDGLGDVAQIVVDDTRLAVGPVASTVYGHPSRSLTTIGITGTNGKTTTAQLIASILRGQGRTTGVVGTLHGVRTTPEAPELQATLASFVAEGASAAVLEVSSHALALHRVDGTSFDAVVFTNLGRDHLDLHGSSEEYFRAKARLFDPVFSPLAVINVDDTYGRLLVDTLGGQAALRIVPVSLEDVSDVQVTAASHSYRWRGLTVSVPLGGRFNVSNSLCALTTAVELGVDPEEAVDALATAEAIPGRFESVEAAAAHGFTVIVDYAHTPDGLAELLAAARSVADHGCSVIAVFGAGGERDHDKRSDMGSIAAELADRVIVTSDNPRREDPLSIIDDILAGMDATSPYVVIEADRRAAIGRALDLARPGDVVVIAGKGHEQTQDLGSVTIEFDDRTVARELLEMRS